jgi:hypothetical protein
LPPSKEIADWNEEAALHRPLCAVDVAAQVHPACALGVGLRGDSVVIIPNNWAELQHYKDRSPPWIKLHKKLLDNYEYQCLPVASKALAPMLWLLASEHDIGHIDADPKKLAFRLRMTVQEAEDALKPLIEQGFFSEHKQRASSALAKPRSVARPETETETETERDLFVDFYEAYPRKVGKDAARKAFLRRKVDEALLARMLEAIKTQGLAQKCSAGESRFVPHPATWLNEGRWQDEAEEAASNVRRLQL